MKSWMQLKKALLKDAGETLKEKISKMSKKQFRNFIKNHLPDGDQMIEIADQYKKVADKYNECKSKIDKWKNTKKGDDLTKFQIAYEELRPSLHMVYVAHVLQGSLLLCKIRACHLCNHLYLDQL